jgi:hypothetical protein
MSSAPTKGARFKGKMRKNKSLNVVKISMAGMLGRDLKFVCLERTKLWMRFSFGRTEMRFEEIASGVYYIASTEADSRKMLGFSK